MTPMDLILRYPWLDEFLAETIISAHERGTLAALSASWPDQLDCRDQFFADENKKQIAHQKNIEDNKVCEETSLNTYT